MKFIQGKDRSQTEFFCLNQVVSTDNEVRLIDLFVSAINLSDYGFKTDLIARIYAEFFGSEETF